MQQSYYYDFLTQMYLKGKGNAEFLPLKSGIKKVMVESIEEGGMFQLKKLETSF